MTEDKSGHKVVEGHNELVEEIWCKISFLLSFFQLVYRLCEMSILINILDVVINSSKGKNLLVVSPVC